MLWQLCQCSANTLHRFRGWPPGATAEGVPISRREYLAVVGRSSPRYDRIASLVLVVALGLAGVLLIDSNPNILRAQLGGDLPTITVSWLLIASLIIITSTGADLLARAHPDMQTRTLPTLNLGFRRFELLPATWLLPAFSIIGSFAFFRLFRGSLQGWAFALALVGAGGLLLAVLIGQHYALDRSPQRHQRARFLLQVTANLLAFGCFSAVYFERFRTLYAAVLIGAAGMLLAYAALYWGAQRSLPLLAACIGLLLAEATWALNYWAAPFLLGGALLLLLFYLATSLLQHHLTGNLQPRLAIEYALLGSGLFVALVYAALLQ